MVRSRRICCAREERLQVAVETCNRDVDVRMLVLRNAILLELGAELPVYLAESHCLPPTGLVPGGGDIAV
jgi:hypothetical protein